MTTEFWALCAAHLVILVFMKRRISRKKKVLEKQKSVLHIENLDLTSKISYYKRELEQLKRLGNAK